MFAPNSQSGAFDGGTGVTMWNTACAYAQRDLTDDEQAQNARDSQCIREGCRRALTQGVMVGARYDCDNLLTVEPGTTEKRIPIEEIQGARVQDLVDAIYEAPNWIDIETNRDSVYLDTMAKHADELIKRVPFDYVLTDAVGNRKKVVLDSAQREAILEKGMPLDRDVFARATIHSDALVSQGKDSSKTKRLSASAQILRGTKSAARIETLTPGSGKSPISLFAFFMQMAYPCMTQEQLRVQAVTTRAHQSSGLMPYITGSIAPVMSKFAMHSANASVLAPTDNLLPAVVFCRGHLVRHWLNEATAVVEACKEFYGMDARVWDGTPGKRCSLLRAQEDGIATVWIMEANTRNCNMALCEHETIAYMHLTIDEGVIEPHDPLRKSSPYVQMTVLLATPETINYCKLDEKNPIFGLFGDKNIYPIRDVGKLLRDGKMDKAKNALEQWVMWRVNFAAALATLPFRHESLPVAVVRI